MLTVGANEKLKDVQMSQENIHLRDIGLGRERQE